MAGNREIERLSRAPTPWLDPAPHMPETAILHAVAYADVFDYPLAAEEIHRYMVGRSAPLVAVRTLLSNGRLVPRHLAHRQGYFTLPGREAIVETRRRRAEVSACVWQQAVRYGQTIASLPFVRMVAVTGALTMDNVELGDDIDYLIVTAPGRLWLCRAIVIELVVKPAADRHVEICPNYLLSERALVLPDRNLYTAHELVQMVPIAGLAIYRRLCQLNGWAARFLPNAYGQPRRVETGPLRPRPVRTLAESILQTPVGAWLERWEMARKVGRLSQQGDDTSDAAFCPDWCKGHFGDHSHLIREGFAHRLRAIGDLTGASHAA